MWRTGLTKDHQTVNTMMDHLGALKTREWKTRYQTAGVENAGVVNAAPDGRGGKRGSGKVWKAKSSGSDSQCLSKSRYCIPNFPYLMSDNI